MTSTDKKLTVTAEPGTQELTLTRVFDAPIDLVFKAHTDPKQIPLWWGPRQYETMVEKMEARSGGEWRFLNRSADGNEYWFHGVYHDIVPSERIVQTFEFEGTPGHVCLETATFEDLGGRTKLTTSSVFQSVEDRDGMVQSGMEQGAGEGFDRLDELLASR
jgi:uncharacterized protein YndB with AHSA1/START domain